jgi:hypothetical protein
MTGYNRLSLKTPNYQDAYSLAKEWFFRVQQMVRDGVSLRQRTFAQAWKEWFNQIDGDGVCDRPPLSGPG